MKSKNKVGRRFEDIVYSLFIKYGFKVERNRILRKKGISAEIDLIIYGNKERCYIECKYRNKPLGLEDVAKYISVLELFSIPFEDAIIVTNKGYTRRAFHYCRQKGLAVYTLQELKKIMGVK